MTDLQREIKEQFSAQSLEIPQDVLFELQSILRIHGISVTELFYKWESYSLKMGGENMKLDFKTARDFKKDIQDSLERETRGKIQARTENKRQVGATPRAPRASAGGDLFDTIEGVSATPKVTQGPASAKRKANFETPASKAAKSQPTSSPADGKAFAASDVPFAERVNAGQIEHFLNDHIEVPNAPVTPWSQPRIKLVSYSDTKKFEYKTTAMKLSEAAEALDDRLEKFRALVQDHYKLEFTDFGNPTIKTPNEIVTVGRIACELQDGRLTQTSMVLETPLLTAGGVRVPLKFDNIPSFDLFPGKIVALRGTNASGDYFQVSEMLKLPSLPSSGHEPNSLDAITQRLRDSGDDEADTKAMNVIVGSGPYTADSNLDYEPLHALCDQAAETCADALILVGPFLDAEHPLVASGDFPDLPASANANADTATITDVFKALITLPIQKLVQAVPSITVLMVPSVRDAISKHAAFPQERMIRKDLGLPKQCFIVTSPSCIFLNEALFAISSQDILYEIKRQECIKGPQKQEALPRLAKQLIDQRHLFPLYPPMNRESLPKPSQIEGMDVQYTQPIGASLDIPYMALADFSREAKPDVLISPSSLSTFVNVVDSVVCINPGSVSKRRAAGTYARMTIQPPKMTDAERSSNNVGAKLFERSRVDVIRI